MLFPSERAPDPERLAEARVRRSGVLIAIGEDPPAVAIPEDVNTVLTHGLPSGSGSPPITRLLKNLGPAAVWRHTKTSGATFEVGSHRLDLGANQIDLGEQLAQTVGHG